MGEMSGKRVVVTGGSSGIGLETARQLVEAGAEVCLVARRGDALKRAVADLGGSAWSHACDVSVESEIAGLKNALAARWEALEGLVNNAGIAPMANLEDTDTVTWDAAFSVNVRGPYLLCRSLYDLLEAGSSPAVVNVSSTLAERAIPGMVAYNASKAALNQLTRSVALEWAPAIRVNAVMPAVVDTPIHSSRGMTPTQVRGMGQMHPLGRVGQTEDVANLIVFLLSYRASWMTGAVVPIDGGMMAG
jgi:meso-butanediol dehydrogenase/(S,S)-butanediol dehydrogenase/diacetyl reductase